MPRSSAPTKMPDFPVGKSVLTLKALWQQTDSGFGDLGGCDDYYIEPPCADRPDKAPVLRNRKVA